MYVVHGTWIPDDTEDFVQGGSFYLWVEVDSASRRENGASPAAHPLQVADESLVAFLNEKLGIRDGYSGAISPTLCRRFFLLPTVNGLPLPSYELQRYVDQDIPVHFELAPWQVCCYPLRDPLRTLNDIHFIALNAAHGLQLGADFLFWHRFSRVIKQEIARDQYIPAIKAREVTRPKGKRTNGVLAVELHPGVEILSHLYEAAIPKYVGAMPTLCVSGSITPSTTFHAKEPLLRHFGEFLLHDVVTGTPFTSKHDQQLAGTFLYRAIYPDRPDLREPDYQMKEYHAWARWREKLAQAQTAAGFTLGFLLEEPPTDDIDEWRLHFQVVSKSDPSYRRRLDHYWPLTGHARAALTRPFGTDFEKQLLLGLGHAARIYPQVWRGLETSQPASFRLTLEEALSFLRLGTRRQLLHR